MVTHTEDGILTFRLFLPAAKSAVVVGDFTEWKESPRFVMEKDPDGWWSVEAGVSEGDHDFCYLVDGSTWLPDYAAHGVRRNRLGGWVGRVHVAAGDRISLTPAA